MKKIKTLEIELAACRAAFAAAPDAKLAWCCHHEVLVEPLTESPEARIEYILQNKQIEQQAVRLRNFRPVRIALPEAYDQAWKAEGQALEAYCRAAKAYDQAWEAYYRAAEARGQAAKAFKQAQEADLPELTRLHAKDWPDHTWNGRSIFK